MSQQSSRMSAQDQQQLTQCVEQMLAEAKALGATGAEVGASMEAGFTVNVRQQDVDTIEFIRDKGIGLTVYFDKRKGTASTTDMSPGAIKETVAAACNIARYTQADNCAGLADKELLAKDYPDCDLNQPWDLDTEQAIEMAKECEAAGFAVDKRINNSEGASIATYQALSVYGNSDGFLGYYPSSRHSTTCILLAQEGDSMERDYEYTVARQASDLLSLHEVGQKAGEQAVKRLHGRSLKTLTAPVLYAPEVASGLMKHYISAISGGNLYRRASFLQDSLNQQIFAKHINFYERPHLKKGLGSSPFDSEGVRTTDRDLVRDGVVQGYVLSSYSARKLKTQTTGNAGGIHNVIFDRSDKDFASMIKLMDKGLIVTELMGQGINLVTGDYSRGAAGYWVENGEIQYPVNGVTIAANLKDMFANIVAIGNDINHNSQIQTGSILIEKMTIAGE